VVLGGGDTGMDCNRTAIRLGAASVTCVYRRDEMSMPGSRREVGSAVTKVCNSCSIASRLALIGDDNKVRAVQVVTTELVDDGKGRVRLRNVEGSEKELRADVVIQAFGFRASPPAWCEAYGIERDRSGRILAGARRPPAVPDQPPESVCRWRQYARRGSGGARRLRRSRGCWVDRSNVQ
jgi:glutamate synthase (NADPH/NADH) small chain